MRNLMAARAIVTESVVANRDAPPYPGLPSTADGSGAVVNVESHISQAACAYPITPSTPMGDGFAAEFANGARNLWGERLEFLEPESEHSSASACEGFALAGGRVTTFTSGQGLIARGRLERIEGGGLRFTEIVVSPVVELERVDDRGLAERVIANAEGECLIANSLLLLVRVEPKFVATMAA